MSDQASEFAAAYEANFDGCVKLCESLEAFDLGFYVPVKLPPHHFVPVMAYHHGEIVRQWKEAMMSTSAGSEESLEAYAHEFIPSTAKRHLLAITGLHLALISDDMLGAGRALTPAARAALESLIAIEDGASWAHGHRHDSERSISDLPAQLTYSDVHSMHDFALGIVGRAVRALEHFRRAGADRCPPILLEAWRPLGANMIGLLEREWSRIPWTVLSYGDRLSHAEGDRNHRLASEGMPVPRHERSNSAERVPPIWKRNGVDLAPAARQILEALPFVGTLESLASEIGLSPETVRKMMPRLVDVGLVDEGEMGRGVTRRATPAGVQELARGQTQHPM